MGVVLFARKRSSEPADTPQLPEQLDDVLAGLRGIANQIVEVEGKGETMIRCIAALQASLELFEGIHAAAADSDDHQQFMGAMKLINSRLRSELTKLSSILCVTRVAAEQVRHLDGSGRCDSRREPPPQPSPASGRGSALPIQAHLFKL
jgi:hypothetical protein